MNNGKKYSVIELAEQLGIKRTTINDWLNRYAIYIESVQQGKRRMYPENALDVLRKIAELRGQGMASADIDVELSKLYAVHPQPEMTEAPQEPVPAQNTLPQLAEEIRKTESAELLRQFQLILEKLDKLEQTEKALPPPPAAETKTAERSGKGAGGLLLLLVFLFLAGLLAAVSLYARQEMEAMQQNSRKQSEEIRRQSAVNAGLKQEVFMLDKSRLDYEENVKRLEKVIADEKAAQQKQLKALESEQQKRIADLEKLRLTEAELQKTKYEKEQQRLAQQLDAQLRKAEQLAQEKIRLAKEKADAEKKLTELRKKAEEAKKTAEKVKTEVKAETKTEAKAEVKAPAVKTPAVPSPVAK